MRSNRLIIGLVFGLMILAVCSNAVKSSPEYPWPDERKADIWILAGQSNMQGWQGYPHIEKQVESDSDLLMFGMDKRWVKAQLPLHRLYEAEAPIHEMLWRDLYGQSQELINQRKEESPRSDQKKNILVPAFGPIKIQKNN